ncbi:Methylisocitrate lyase [hydrothermal vent metagenome]|uniref:Methylisocitrate lyase n=1 Tax=hydrothermal vent metagenome TaxID=652676 RepID=A0A3B0ZJ87_9ZZZZ
MKRIKSLHESLSLEHPLQVVGVINAYCALLAEQAGFRALYLSGAGVANASYGLPDLGMTTLDDVAIDVQRIARVTSIPLLVDADTGWSNPELTTATLIKAGASGLHLEDQIEQKRCGHRPGKTLVSSAEMIDRIKSAVQGKNKNQFTIMARTDAFSVEGLDAAIKRSQAYIEAGADMIFAESLRDITQYKTFTQEMSAPVLANITEFGKTPLYTRDELNSVGIQLMLYPLTLFRTMSKTAIDALAELKQEGTQQGMIHRMQTRESLYDCLDYHRHEEEQGKRP